MSKSREMPFDPTKTIEDIAPPKFDNKDVQKDKSGESRKVETKHGEENEKKFNIKEIVETTVQNAVQKAFLGFIDGTYTLEAMRKPNILQVIKQDIINQIIKIHPDRSSPEERKKLQKKLIEEPAEDSELADKQWEEQFVAVDQLNEMIANDQEIKTRTEGWVTLDVVDEEIMKQAPEAEKRASVEGAKRKLAEMKVQRKQRKNQQEAAERLQIEELKAKLGIKKRNTGEQSPEKDRKAA